MNNRSTIDAELNQLNLIMVDKNKLNPIKGGVTTKAITNCQGQLTKSAGNYDADSKTSDSDIASSISIK